MSSASLPDPPASDDADHRLGARSHSAPGLQSVAAALSYRETGNPFPSIGTARHALRIGLCSSLSWGFLRDLIRCASAGPNAPALSFVEGTPHEILRAVNRGEADIGFVYGTPALPRLVREELWRERPMILLPEGHPLASDSDVRPEALWKETFIVAGGPVERDMQIRLVERTIGGAPADMLAIPVTRETLTDLVGLGFGLALTSGSALGAFHPGAVYRPIAAPVEAIPFHAVWRPTNVGEGLARFLELARVLAAEGGA